MAPSASAQRFIGGKQRPEQPGNPGFVLGFSRFLVARCRRLRRYCLLR